MKTIQKLLPMLALSLLLAACGTGADPERTQNPGVTEDPASTQAQTESQEATEVAGTTEAQATDNGAEATETAPETTKTTETATEATETATETAQAGQSVVESGRITNYEVDFSDVEGIRSMTAGHVDDDLLVLALVSEADAAEQEVAVFRVENGQKQALFTITIPQQLEFIGAVAGDDDELHFTAVNRTDENIAGAFTVYRVDLDDQEVHTLYEGAADDLNYGQNLATDDDTVFFTENMWEEDGLYFADVVMVKGDGKQVVNVEVFPSEHVSLLVEDEELMYAASRDDEQYIVVYDYENGGEPRGFQVAGDNANFRLTDHEDEVYLLDNYNGHSDMQGSMVLRVNAKNEEIRAHSSEGKNLHTAVFADPDDTDDDVILAVASTGSDLLWVQTDEEATAELQEIAGDISLPAGSAFTGVFEEDNAVIRYPKAVTQDYYANFRLVYQVFR